MKTIGEVLEENKGIGPGFDFLRIALATMVLLYHSILIVKGDYNLIDHYKLWGVFGSILPMFFALSGFLITGSAQRLKLKDFLLNRSLRIVPALAVDIVVSDLVIGTCFTILPLRDYFSNKEFLHYFLNIIGFIHYLLPGVFLDNPFPGQVNGSLWTVPYEIGCYAIMSAFIVFGVVKSLPRILIATMGFCFLYVALQFYFMAHTAPFSADTPFNNYMKNFYVRGSYLYFSFIAGAFLYTWRSKVPLTGIIAALAMLAIGLLKVSSEDNATTSALLALPIAYLTVYIGLLPIKKIPLYCRGDYSYGIYLYGFPLQQLLIVIFRRELSIPLHFFISMMLATCVAMFSWHVIEKPILSLRKKFSFTARKGDAN